jgi:hypothetical protein
MNSQKSSAWFSDRGDTSVGGRCPWIFRRHAEFRPTPTLNAVTGLVTALLVLKDARGRRLLTGALSNF